MKCFLGQRVFNRSDVTAIKMKTNNKTRKKLSRHKDTPQSDASITMCRRKSSNSSRLLVCLLLLACCSAATNCDRIAEDAAGKRLLKQQLSANIHQIDLYDEVVDTSNATTGKQHSQLPTRACLVCDLRVLIISQVQLACLFACSLACWLSNRARACSLD